MRKILIIAAILVVGVVALLFAAGYYLSPEDKLAKADAIVVISGGETERRVELGVSIYKEGYAPALIVSGAAAEGVVSNAKSMASYAISAGVPRSDIYLDENAKNTFENALEVKKILEKNNFNSIILVSSPYHLRRAGIIFKQVSGAKRVLRRAALDSKWSKSSWFYSSYGRERTVQELSGIAYYYFIQKRQN